MWKQKIVKLAVFERHHKLWPCGIGFLGNYGLRCGAVASSIAHDPHNLIVAGTNDADMALAGNRVLLKWRRTGICRQRAGGWSNCPSPVAGLMSTEDAVSVENTLRELKAALREYGISAEIDAFMTLAFLSACRLSESFG